MWINEKFVEAQKKTMSVTPNGWKGPLTIEYTIMRVGKFDPFPSVCFRVKGTNHTFASFENNVNTSFCGDYKTFFERTLETFRENFLEWKNSKLYSSAPWFEEYENEYRGKIIIQ